MENKDESIRLELKTDFERLERQARWAGLKDGMRVADIGCGPGITSFYLKQITGETGSVVGFDNSTDRISYARNNYSSPGIEFVCGDIINDMDSWSGFDFVWVRFFLEYYRKESRHIVKKISRMLKPGGIMCLIDLDHNSMNHYGLSERLENTMKELVSVLESENNFDPYAGRKLYSYLYGQDFRNINVSIDAHHLIYGELSEVDDYNWTRKIAVSAKKSGFRFRDYPGGFEEFFEEYNSFFSDPGRFTYTPLISCRGEKSDS